MNGMYAQRGAFLPYRYNFPHPIQDFPVIAAIEVLLELGEGDIPESTAAPEALVGAGGLGDFEGELPSCGLSKQRDIRSWFLFSL